MKGRRRVRHIGGDPLSVGLCGAPRDLAGDGPADDCPTCWTIFKERRGIKTVIEPAIVGDNAREAVELVATAFQLADPLHDDTLPPLETTSAELRERAEREHRRGR